MSSSHHNIWLPAATIVATVTVLRLYQLYVEKRAKALAQTITSVSFAYRRFDWNWLLLPLSPAVVAVLLWELTKIAKSFGEVGWLLGLAMTLFILLMAFAFTAPFVMNCLIIRDTWKRNQRREQVSINADNISFTAKNDIVEARWDDITDYYITPVGGWWSSHVRYVVVTTNGMFAFTAAIRNFHMLREIISRRAIHAAVTDWQARPKPSSPSADRMNVAG